MCLYQRATGSGCLAVSALMWLLFVATQAFSQSSNALAQEGTIFDSGPAAALGAVTGVLGLVTSVAGTFFVCVARRAARARDAIPPSCCNEGLDDCCVSYWCAAAAPPCSCCARTASRARATRRAARRLLVRCD